MRSQLSLFGGILVLAAALSGCTTVAGGGQHGSGPLTTFAFTTAANPGLQKDVTGRIIAQGEPELIIVVVPHGVDLKKLIATVELNTKAVVSVVTGDQRVVQANGITVNDFSSPVLYSIEVPGEKEPWGYRVMVREADTNARLAQITLPARVVLQPAFNPAVEQYTIQAPFEIRKLSVAALAESPSPQSITIADTSTPGHLAVTDVDFSSGQQSTFIISVLAEDGTTRSKYTFIVKRNPADSNAQLGVLDIPDTALSPTFAPNKFAYSASVPFEARQVVLNVQAQSPFASVSLTVTGSSTAPTPVVRGASAGSVRVDFPTGGRLPLVLTVTAQDGTTQQYKVDILRREASNNNKLADLAVSGGQLTPAFKPDVMAYTADVPYSTARITIRAVPQDRTATVTLDTALASDPNAPSSTAVNLYPPDSAGGAVDFRDTELKGLNIIATAQNGETLRYTLLLHRSAPDRTADLSSLTASAGTLTPAFSVKADTYSLRIPADAKDVQLTAVAASPLARVSLFDQSTASPAQTLTIPINVDPGTQNVMRLVVTAEDGTQRLFQVNVAREVAK
jgi:hypothetical protein